MRGSVGQLGAGRARTTGGQPFPSFRVGSAARRARGPWSRLSGANRRGGRPTLTCAPFGQTARCAPPATRSWEVLRWHR
eukprot:8422208-Alexandrium_andersonii.AAC.1